MLRQRGKTWYADFSVRGRRIVRSCGTTIRQEAQEAHDKWRAEAWRESHLDQKPSVTFEKAAGAWVKTKAKNRDIESTKDKLRFAVEVKHHGKRIGSLPVDKVDSAVIDSIIEAKRKLGKTNGGKQSATHRPISDATLNRYLSAISAVLNFAHGKAWVTHPPKIEKLEEDRASQIWITQEQAAALISELPEHLAIMARFALATGLRRHNVTHLRWDQIDLKRAVAWVDAEDSKNNESIAIPLSDDAMAILRGQAGKHASWAFPYRDGPVERTYTAAFKAAMAKAGIDPRFRWHNLRTTWATWHVMGGTPLGELMRLGGWHSFDIVLKHYAKYAPGHLAQFANNSKLQIGNRT